MESVKYTTQKSRPNLFREVSGAILPIKSIKCMPI